MLPDNKHNQPVVLLVHGDGAQDSWSDGGHLPLVNTLVAQGIGVVSWDKPGVAASTSNWLAQTLRDRADEVVAALHALSARPEKRVVWDFSVFLKRDGWYLMPVSVQR
ncbi:MAG: alpha/beta hydrolase family protein [Symbiopectobacterium sp.]|uniref:alpha/beta hydrolase family protein n=1 Tax=Symbiopectobacterium sp. TaxID=2952789 RepID=UPI003F40D942